MCTKCICSTFLSVTFTDQCIPVQRKRVMHKSYRKGMWGCRQSSKKEASLKSLRSPTATWAFRVRERRGQRAEEKWLSSLGFFGALEEGKREHWIYFSKAVLVRPKPALNHTVNLVKMQTLISRVWHRAQDSAFSTGSQLVVMALVFRAHSEEQGPRAPFQRDASQFLSCALLETAATSTATHLLP